MSFKQSLAAAALLAVAPVVNAVGSAIVQNECDYPVYLWSVSNVAGDMYTLDPNGGNFSQPYYTNPNGGGIAIKLSKSSNQWDGSPITQLEYTLTDSLWYDVSNINGYPFQSEGLTLVPGETGCPSVLCPAGVAQCSNVYNHPNDNLATKNCGTDGDTVLVLCSSQDTSGSPDAVASSVVAPLLSAVSEIAGTATATSAPLITSVAAAPSGGPIVFTTFVTAIITAVEPAQSSSSDDEIWAGHEPADKRDELHHPHRHQHPHAKHFD